ncbi:hypothetical protein SNE40_018326 [Patella caerulea]|uniref:Retrotransposon gag domain-containing protein n=1 Tax=Patella caerulea TaxID=87958 RepID=A0AAN8JBK5_PATCE
MAGSRDIKMSPFLSESDPILTGPKWAKWLDEFGTRLRYFRITDDQDRVDAINIYGGEEARDKIKNLRDIDNQTTGSTWNDDDDVESDEDPPTLDNYTKIINKLNGYYVPLKNISHAKFRFGQLTQGEGETINQYAVRLREYAMKCEFPNMDDQILYHLTLTIRDKDFRREAMDKQYNLQKFLQKAQSREETHRQASEIEGERERGVNRTLTYRGRFPKNHSERDSTNHYHEKKEENYDRKHQVHDCPSCKCDQRNRFRSPHRGRSRNRKYSFHRNRSRYRSQSQSTSRKVKFEEGSDEADCVYYSKLTNKINYGNEYSAKVKVHINDVKVQCEADSASGANLIDEDRFQQIQDRLPASQKLN